IEKRSALAIMVPHAGLRFSGRVAADVWRRVQVPDRVLIIGPKHTRDGADWAIAPHDAWQLATSTSIAGDVQTAKELCECLPGMKLDRLAHAREHGIEVQLPFMHRFCPESRLTAIAMNGGTPKDFQKLAGALAAWMREQVDPPLLFISSDMNHFAEDKENRRRDRLALDAVAGGDGMELLRVCESEKISMCGQVPAAIVMMTLSELGVPSQSIEVAYATSADNGGDPNRVVGYAGVIW
ncbi:MAG: AmmeMemoRadiSam system protein B, partial [Planctomycetota bacterium]